MNPWTYLILWMRAPDGWVPFDQTKPARMSKSEAVAAVWKLRGEWNNYSDPVGVYTYRDGLGWRLAAMQRDPMGRIALR